MPAAEWLPVRSKRCPISWAIASPYRQVTLLGRFSKETVVATEDTALFVSEDSRWILDTQFDQAGSDLMLVENFR